MDEHQGRDTGKVILGVVLIFVGTLWALKFYPRAPHPSPPTAAHTITGTSTMATQYMIQSKELKCLQDEVLSSEEQRAHYFKSLMLALLLVHLGGLSLYLSGESKKA